MQNTKKTKVVSTLGPSTDSPKIIETMMNAGVNIFRINFSHANYDDVKKKIKIIRDLNV
jgi:pyruvate kinase